jgi:hydroxylamine reductase (hybrid-cluster protein)
MHTTKTNKHTKKHRTRPGLKKFPHLVGNYGGAWYKQKKEFGEFPGAILVGAFLGPKTGL